MARLYMHFVYHKIDPVYDHRGFAAPRAGQHHHGALPVPDRGALAFAEFLHPKPLMD